MSSRIPSADVTPRERLRARREAKLVLRRLSRLALVILVLLVAGTVANALVEGISLWMGFVWTLDTVATVGAIANLAIPADR